MSLDSGVRASEVQEPQGESGINLDLSENSAQANISEISNQVNISKNGALNVLENINIYNSANKVLWRSFVHNWETVIVNKEGRLIVLTWSYFEKFWFDKAMFDDKWNSRQLSTQAIIDIFDLFCIK